MRRRVCNVELGLKVTVHDVPHMVRQTPQGAEEHLAKAEAVIMSQKHLHNCRLQLCGFQNLVRHLQSRHVASRS